MAEPVTLAEAKAHLRIVDDDSEDALITGYIAAARGWIENHTGRILVEREVTEEVPSFGRFFDLHWRPFDAETVTIAYTDSDGAPGEVTDLTVSGQRVHPGYDTWWPTTRLNTPVLLTYTAGYAEGEVPDELRQAILLLVGHWWTNREAVTDRPANEVPLAVESLCGQYRAPIL
jgi:uncharacterized phiE125 gp8 family phage protein